MKLRMGYIRRNSLFVKLLTGFLIVIVLLLSFNLLSFAFFKNNIQQEIIDNATLNLSNSVELYEKHFSYVEDTVMEFYFNENLSHIRKREGEALDYYEAYQINKEIAALTNKDPLFAENMMVIFRDSELALDKQGVYNIDQLFSKYYVSDSYNVAFWKNQFAESYALHLYPNAVFHETNYDMSVTLKGNLLPFVIKNMFNNRYIVVILMDTDRMFQEYSRNGEDHFFILDESREVIFRTEADTQVDNPVNGSGLPVSFDTPLKKGYANINHIYYMYEKGQHTGLTYVYAVPNGQIVDQVARLNWVLLYILVAALVLSVIISVLFSMRLNSPIQRMVQQVLKTGPQAGRRSKIHEFDLISDNISNMISINHSFSQDIKIKDHLLKNLGYMNQIKSIYQWEGLRTLIETSKPFYLVAFKLMFKKQFRSLMTDGTEKASYDIKELINININEMKETCHDFVTLQMEKDLILALIFADEQVEAVQGVLDQIKRTIETDKEYCYLTMAFHQVRRNPEELAVAYEEARGMCEKRKLNQDTQIVTEVDAKGRAFRMSSVQANELEAALQSGQEDKVLKQIDQFLYDMDTKQANVRQFAEFGNEVVINVVKSLTSYHTDIGSLLHQYSPSLFMEEFATVNEYTLFFQQFITAAMSSVQQRKPEGKDPIINYVLNYLDQHFGGDVSLEQLADRLDLSRSYLSTYFHEKTGKKFIHYLNEMRIGQAKKLLCHTDKQIQDIAAEVGYQNVNSFIRMFKQFCGLTPGEFRRNTLIGGPPLEQIV